MSTMFTAAAPQHQRDLGDHPRPVRHADAQLVHRPAGEV